MDDERSSPVVIRWVLGERLREYREAAGLTASAVARRLGWAPSKLSRIENHDGVSPGDVRELLDVYGVTDPADVRPVADMARQGQQRGWWQQGYGGVLPPWFGTFVGLEAGAAEEHDYKGALVTGLLQTPQYARALISTAVQVDGTSPSPGEVERLISLRLERQRMLHLATDPLRLVAVMDETVLARRVGGADVMRAQLRHLADMAENPNVTIQILPAEHVHPALEFPFCLLRFASMPGLVYMENFRQSLILEDETDVSYYSAAFADLRGRALDPAQSRALVLDRMKAVDAP